MTLLLYWWKQCCGNGHYVEFIKMTGKHRESVEFALTGNENTVGPDQKTVKHLIEISLKKYFPTILEFMVNNFAGKRIIIGFCSFFCSFSCGFVVLVFGRWKISKTVPWLLQKRMKQKNEKIPSLSYANSTLVKKTKRCAVCCEKSMFRSQPHAWIQQWNIFWHQTPELHLDKVENNDRLLSWQK